VEKIMLKIPVSGSWSGWSP